MLKYNFFFAKLCMNYEGCTLYERYHPIYTVLFNEKVDCQISIFLKRGEIPLWYQVYLRQFIVVGNYVFFFLEVGNCFYTLVRNNND